MKNAISIVMSLVLGGALVACSSSSGGGGGNNPAVGQGTCMAAHGNGGHDGEFSVSRK